MSHESRGVDPKLSWNKPANAKSQTDVFYKKNLLIGPDAAPRHAKGRRNIHQSHETAPRLQTTWVLRRGIDRFSCVLSFLSISTISWHDL